MCSRRGPGPELKATRGLQNILAHGWSRQGLAVRDVRHHHLCVDNCQHRSWCVIDKQETWWFDTFLATLKPSPSFWPCFGDPLLEVSQEGCEPEKALQRGIWFPSSSPTPLPLIGRSRGPPDSSAVNGWVVLGHCLVKQRGPQRVVLHRGKKSSLFVK